MFSPQTFADRRRVLADAIPSGLIVLLGNDVVPMNYPANLYPFRQDGSFLYYAGLDAPGLALTIDADTGEAVLYGHDPTLDDVVWEGPLDSLADRAASVGITKTAATEDLDEAIRAASLTGRSVHVLPPYRGTSKIKLAALLGQAPDGIDASEALIDAVIAQRLVKSAEEIEAMHEATVIADQMHRTAMRHAHPGQTEHTVAAAMEAVALAAGGYLSFPAIVTVRGEVLHNHATGTMLQEGDLLLHDAGAHAPGHRYASDVTRVSPVGGTFSEKQRAIYDIVLDAQERTIAGCAPGVPFVDLHLLAAKTIVEGLQALGLMKGDADEAVAAGAHALFMPHGLGHAIGLDVHDLEGLGEDRVGYGEGYTRSSQFGTAYLRFARPLRPGYVMTVEPGLYLIDPLIDKWQAEGMHTAFLNYEAIDGWRGLGGVRIEDDVVITEDGHRVLGPGIPKSVEAVEAQVQAGA